MMDVPGPQSAADGVSEHYGQQYVDGHCHAATQHLVTGGLSIYSQSPATACHAQSHCALFIVAIHS
jgi:hypothetical protein